MICAAKRARGPNESRPEDPAEGGRILAKEGVLIGIRQTQASAPIDAIVGTNISASEKYGISDGYDEN